MRNRHLGDSPAALDRPYAEQDVDGADILGDERAYVLPDLSTEQPEWVVGVAKSPRRKRRGDERDAT
jgi:hypothetical protein